MCGHFGIVNFMDNSPANYDKFMKDGFITGSLRGKHSCGLFVKSINGTRETLFKKAILPWDFIEEREFTTALLSNHCILMGHNRHATRGKVNDKGAHPFKHEHITLAHNGTLNTHRNLTKKSNEFEIDSEAICHYLSVEEDTNKVLEALDGDYALVWFNDQRNSFNFARNPGRELYLAYVKNAKDELSSIVYASEKGMLSWLCERNSIKIEKPFLLESGEHWEIFLENKIKGEISKTKFTPKEKTISYSNHDFYGYYRREENSSGSIYQRHFHNPIPIKYSNLLVNRNAFQVRWTSWVPYKSGLFGKLIGYYNGELKIENHGIPKEKISVYLNGNKFDVAANGWDGSNEVLSVKIIKESDNSNVLSLPPPPTPTHNKDNKGLTNEQLRELYQNQLDSESTSNRKKKDSEKCCSNCDIIIEEDESFVVANGHIYCTDCVETNAEYFEHLVH